MAGIPPVAAAGNSFERTRTASSFQFIYDQIDALRRQAESGATRGVLSTDFVTAFGQRLNAIEASIDAGISDRSMSRTELRRYHEELHDVRISLVQARRAGTDSQAAPPGSADEPSPPPARALDISV